MLNHPFYKSWNDGKLTREIIKDYAEQYYQHVKAFPRYISATHSLCEDIEKRKILLENLQDEENRDGDHPKLWRNFATTASTMAKFSQFNIFTSHLTFSTILALSKQNQAQYKAQLA